MPATNRTLPRRIDKARALLRSVTAAHEPEQYSADHKWRECRVCLAFEELEHNEAARRMVRELIDYFDALAS